MTADAPLAYIWEGDVFRPATVHWARKADKQFVIGQEYHLVEYHPRSMASHNAFFAQVHEAHKNLPDELAERYPTPEHLRKYCLIKAGFCDTQTVVFASRKDAEKAAALVIPLDEFSVVDVRDTTLTRYVAKSQSFRAMGKDDFQKSKEEVIRIMAEMLGTTTEALQSAGGEE